RVRHHKIAEVVHGDCADDFVLLVLNSVPVPKPEHAILIPEDDPKLGGRYLLDQPPGLLTLDRWKVGNPVQTRIKNGWVGCEPVHSTQEFWSYCCLVVRKRIVVNVLDTDLVTDHDSTTGTARGASGRAHVDGRIPRGGVIHPPRRVQRP